MVSELQSDSVSSVNNNQDQTMALKEQDSNLFNSANSSSLMVAGNLDPLSVKLAEVSFLLWRPLVMTTIRGHGLTDCIQESRYIPSKTFNDDSVNPEFTRREQQDQLLASECLIWFLKNFLTQLLGCVTSFET